SAQELLKQSLKFQFQLSSPFINPKRYMQIGRKLIKQRNPLWYRNVIRLPALIKNLYNVSYQNLKKKGILQNFYEHPYKTHQVPKKQLIQAV
ncbi:MAG: hypothetical protein ACFFKA_18545, partial [Candidatus Thorarchaeota archaeon]